MAYEDFKSVWQNIYNHLNNKNWDVYPPATKKGECLDVYIVLRFDGGSQVIGYSSDVQYYAVLLYVPINRYSETETLMQKLKKDMQEMFPQVKPTGLEQPTFYDQQVNAHMTSVRYQNYKKIDRRK